MLGLSGINVGHRIHCWRHWQRTCCLPQHLRLISSGSSLSVTGWLDWIVQCFTSTPTPYRLYGRRFYRSKNPTNSIRVLKEMLQRKNQTTETTKYTYAYTIIDKKDTNIQHNKSQVYINMGWLGDGETASAWQGIWSCECSWKWTTDCCDCDSILNIYADVVMHMWTWTYVDYERQN